MTRAPSYPPLSTLDSPSRSTMLALHPQHPHYNICNEQQPHFCQAGLPHRSHSQDHHYAQAPSLAPHEVYRQHHNFQHNKGQRTRSMPHRVYSDAPLTRAPSVASTASSATSTTSVSCASDPTVVQALEIARESPDGASDPTIGKILDGALGQIWSKVQAAPNTYVMTREEFSIFNYFQHRFVDNATARRARGRYWDHARG